MVTTPMSLKGFKGLDLQNPAPKFKGGSMISQGGLGAVGLRMLFLAGVREERASEPLSSTWIILFLLYAVGCH